MLTCFMESFFDWTALLILVIHIVGRLHKPQCDLDPAWEEEDLDKATIRTITLLHEVTVGSKDQPGKPFNAPGFCYIFPLLKVGECIERDEHAFGR